MRYIGLDSDPAYTKNVKNGECNLQVQACLVNPTPFLPKIPIGPYSGRANAKWTNKG
jgi:hypothetical protein